MATDNKQKVLIRSMSVEEIENYMVNSDINGKITPKNEDTWHHSYNNFDYSQYRNRGFILSNESSQNKNEIFVNKINNYDSNKISILGNKLQTFVYDDFALYPNIVMLFRPLIEYKE